MSLWELLLLSIGLSMDAFAVCMSNGLVFRGLKLSDKAKIVVVFGLFHFFMPVLGYFTGTVLMHFISSFDHWIALLLLLYVGGEMILDFRKDYQEYKEKKGESEQRKRVYTLKTLMLQSVAVSIDAIAVGLSFVAVDINVWTASAIIALVCMLFCMLGFFVGKKFGLILKHRSQLLGGIILIGIGVKVFLEHMLGSL